MVTQLTQPSTITAQGELNIKGNGLNDYLRVSNDFFGVWMDGAQEIIVSPTETTFNASSRAVDFAVLSDDGTQLIRTRAEKNIVRLHDHVSINQPTGWNWDNEQQQALAVSGTSVFYSGGTSHNTEAIVAIGNISGTTDLHIDGDMYSGTTNLLDIFASSGITNQDVYWSATTDGDITTSGNTDVRISGNTYVSGDTHTTNLVLAANGYIMPATSSNTIKIRAQDYDGEMLSIGPDLFNVNMNSAANFQISPTQVTFNISNIDQDFRVMSDAGNFSIQTNAEYNLLALSNAGGTSIGGTTSRWPTVNGQPAEATQNLLVHGITTIYSGGPETYSWSGDTTALRVVGNISGTTDLYLGDSVHTASTITAEESLTLKGRGVDNDYLHLAQDRMQFWLDGIEFATFTSLTHPSAGGGITFNSSGQDYDFKIIGADHTSIFQTDAIRNAVRLRDHLTIGNATAVDWTTTEYWGLAVTGSSLFYSGGTLHPNEAIVAEGNISGTTDFIYWW